MSHGFYLEGFPIACGIDLDEKCRYAFETNNEAPFVSRDISKLSGKELNNEFFDGVPRILVGCAPCQPFSLYNQKNDDPQWNLLKHFGRLISEVKPEIVSMENVPRLEKFRQGSLFKGFVNTLRDIGYSVWWKNVFCPDYGVPQSRTRLVLLASLLGEIRLEQPTHSKNSYITVRDAIGNLSKIESGETSVNDVMHRCSRLSKINLRRIKASKPGGTWKDWNPKLVTKCHKRESGKGYSSVYGRMGWNEPSPTITTQFYGFGNGRFGHPEQDRALSLREGAILQSFPSEYEFCGPGEKININHIGRMIGNAVPVALAQAIARTIKHHLKRAKSNGKAVLQHEIEPKCAGAFRNQSL